MIWGKMKNGSDKRKKTKKKRGSDAQKGMGKRVQQTPVARTEVMTTEKEQGPPLKIVKPKTKPVTSMSPETVIKTLNKKR